MKKFKFLLASIAMVLVMIIACEEPAIVMEEAQKAQEEELLARNNPKGKVIICHYDNILMEYYQLSINENALDSHLDNHKYTDGSDSGPLIVSINGEEAADDRDKDGIADCADCDPDDPRVGEKRYKYYKDEDGDGYGNKDIFKWKCETRVTLVGWTQLFEECDDDSTVNPGVTEICDGIDNNCDGDIDEGFDQDNDGFTTCQGDCDDDDDQIFPFSPYGAYVFIKEVNGTHYFHNIMIDGFDGTFYTGSGIREDGSDTFYLDIRVVVDGSGNMTMNIEQWKNDSDKSGDIQNCWELEGIVLECGGVDRQLFSHTDTVLGCQLGKPDWFKSGEAYPHIW